MNARHTLALPYRSANPPDASTASRRPRKSASAGANLRHAHDAEWAAALAIARTAMTTAWILSVG
jgi:hypothetical protein